MSSSRFPFHSDGGNRGCCNGKTYDTNNMICCSDGRVDIACEPADDPCDPNPCQFDGICTTNTLTNLAKCECKDPYRGDFCEKISRTNDDVCRKNPCQNGGKCKNDNGIATCKCQGDFRGPFCDISPCFPSPCLNKGQCLVLDSEAVCQCKEGYTGKNCESNPCDPSPCNSGECTVFDNEAFCTCPDGFEGTNCEVETKDPCIDFDCLNGGECFPNTLNVPSCQCPSGFKGQFCEIEDEPVTLPPPVAQSSADVCESKPLDLVFVLDASGSSKFQNEFFKGAKEFLEGFLDEFVLDTFVNVGIISFANEVELNLPLKAHPANKVKKRLNAIFARDAENSTLNAALEMASQQLKGSQADRAVVVLSDFWSTDSFFPSEASLSLAFRGASIFSVGLSSEMMELYARDH